MAMTTTTSTQLGPAPIGPYRIIAGTFTSADTDSGGDITTGFNAIIACGIFPTSHLGAMMPKYTVSGGTITIVTGNGVDGGWWAIGR